MITSSMTSSTTEDAIADHSDDDSDDDTRLASLDALRLALRTAPFLRSTSRQDDQSNGLSCAVHVRDLCFRYGEVRVLDRISCKVTRGQIYALCGSGSCGKTTFLRCLLGHLRPQRGHIHVFGTCVTGAGRVPGVGVGFMPQQMALYEELSVEEVFQYFGLLNLMPTCLVRERSTQLLALFALPNRRRLVRHLSDNQRWRVSLAVALLHAPPLLLLDTPTARVDPLIRRGVWERLRSLSVAEGLTAVVTCDDFEEATEAHRLALMRAGRLVAEDEPHALLTRFHVLSVRALFEKLCAVTPLEQISEEEEEEEEQEPEAEHWCPPMADWPLGHRRLARFRAPSAVNLDLSRFRAILTKNLFYLRGQRALVLFYFLFPSLQLVLFGLAIGLPVKDVAVAVVDSDQSPISQRLIRSLDTSLVSVKENSSLNQSLAALNKGHVSAVIRIASNQSSLTPSLHLSMDFSNPVLSQQLLLSLIQSLHHFLSPHLWSLHSPFKLQELIRGQTDPDLRSFFVPGFLVAAVFAAPLLLTTHCLIKDQTEGLLERQLSTGSSALELVCAHFFSQSLLLLLQETILLLCSHLLLLRLTVQSLLPVLLITLSSGVTGICFGLLLAAISSGDQLNAILISSATLFPGLLMSGIAWPIESMPRPLNQFCQLLPLTLPIDQLRAVLWRKSVSLFHWPLLFSVAISGLYALSNASAAVVVFKYRTLS